MLTAAAAPDRSGGETPAAVEQPQDDGWRLVRPNRRWTPRPRPPPNQRHLAPVSPMTITALQDLNRDLFPVKYNSQFYSDVLHRYGRDLSALCMDGPTCVGAICCRREPDAAGHVVGAAGAKTALPPEHLQLRCCVYIMTLGVRPERRRGGIASALLAHVLAACGRDPRIVAVRLHVHVGNSDALAFYERHGFAIVDRVTDYYRNNLLVEPPPDAYLLELCAFGSPSLQRQ